MSNFMKTILERRSIRKYIEGKDVPEDMLNQIIEAARWAPSWANTQCCELIIIKDKETKKSLQETIGKNPAVKAVAQAPVVIGVCGKLGVSGFYKEKATTELGDWFLFDLGLAVQNICITAQSFGLGTVIIGSFDHKKAKSILEIPDGYRITVFIPLGYPDQMPSAPKRKEKQEIVHIEKF